MRRIIARALHNHIELTILSFRARKARHGIQHSQWFFGDVRIGAVMTGCDREAVMKV